MTRQSRPSLLIIIAALVTVLGPGGVFADSAGVILSEGNTFSEQTGEALYANVCAACHMDQGKGAVGAGKYPALAKNENLAAGGYAVTVVVHGYKGMPPVGQMMSDEQVAAVVNYVRTNFGNAYTDAVTVEDVASAR
jgi:mono/diheme cytochrome c family protein